MLARVMTLHFDTVLGGFDDTPLREFLKDKEVLAIRDHFFIRNDVPYLAMIFTYTLPHLTPPAAPAAPAHQPDESSWRSLVTPEEVPLFNALRDWRLERSKQEDMPPYVICTNKMLAAMVKARPQSLTQLGSIEHFGKAKLEKYGRELRAIKLLRATSILTIFRSV